MRVLWLTVGLAVATSAMAGGQVDFVREVRPILERHCQECHGPGKQKNDYRLDIKQVALTGGSDHAPNIRPGDSAGSPLYRFVSGQDKKIHMPPKSKDPLAPEDVATLQLWIDQGAHWPDGADTAKLVDKTDWWSWKPLQLPQTPAAPADKRYQIRNEVDAFVVAKLIEKGLPQAPEADRGTLIRRLYFDLIGLPPSPEDVAAFLADSDPQAYEKLVDRLLESPRYGERWARHWLDLVHYGETHGYDKDKPRSNAWPYRDYVIRAFNEDKPYARFVQEQLAGDVLFPGTVDGVVALGFIAAGPWDLIGHQEVPESKIDGKIARHLDRDDMVQNTLGAFCSLTVGCAQCHDHKFDPISQEDYYSLQAVFAALDRTEVKYYPDAAFMARYHRLDDRRDILEREIAALESPLIKKAGDKYAELSRRIEGAKDKAASPNETPDFGYHSLVSSTQDATKWVQVDLGESATLDRIVLLPCYDDYNKIGAGFGFPIRFKIECSDDPEFRSGVTLVWRRHDQTFMNDFPNPGLSPFETKTARDDGVRGRYVRVTAVKLAPRKNDYIFALAEMLVFDVNDRNMALGRPVTAMDSIEAPPRWRRSNLTDAAAPQPRSADERKRLTQERDALLRAVADKKTREKLAAMRNELAAMRAELEKLPAPSLVYAGGIHNGNGAFRGTGPDGGKPRVIHVLKRGDVKNPGEEAPPGAIDAISRMSALPSRFKLPTDGEEADRRAALAAWITSEHNALTWRSIANRVWQHHFGRPLADTPNDFGRMGGEPSNPQLLDWLAAAFRDELHGSIKSLHRLILRSHAYRQVSQPAGAAGARFPAERYAAAAAADSANTHAWRQNRAKLDAECVRDAILSISGKLDLTMGGPGFRDFVIEHPEHSPHYQYDMHDPEDPACHRRSIYRFIVRSQQQPFMTVMDCADPSMRVDKRNESLSPLQALAMLNNGLVVAMAGHFAERVRAETNGIEADARRAFELALSRSPAPGELEPLVEYARRDGLENLCRLLINLNEFTFVD